MPEELMSATKEQLYMERREHSLGRDHFRSDSKLSNLSDSVEFPRLSKKRPAHKFQKMPRFPNQAKKFKPFLPESQDPLFGPDRGKLSLSNNSASTPKSPTLPEPDHDQFNVTFESGCPNKFWLYADTDALYDLQAVINVSLDVIENILNNSNDLFRILYQRGNLIVMITRAWS